MTITNEQMEAAVAEMQAQFRTYMASPEFKARADAACARIEAGENLDNAALGEALGVPERLVEIAMVGQITKVAVAGADLAPWEIAHAAGESPEQIMGVFDAALGLLLNPPSVDPDLANLMRTAEFRKAVERQREFIDDDTTLRKLASALKIPVEVVSWAFFETRARAQLAERSIN